MIKSFIKEAFILILFCLAIALVLGIIFYEYIPSNQVIETAEVYVIPQDLKEELATSVKEEETLKIIQTYEISKESLTNDKYNGKYNEGKVNPFAEYALGDTNTDDDKNNTNNTGSDSNNSGSSNTTVPVVNTVNQNKR